MRRSMLSDRAIAPFPSCDVLDLMDELPAAEPLFANPAISITWLKSSPIPFEASRDRLELLSSDALSLIEIVTVSISPVWRARGSRNKSALRSRQSNSPVSLMRTIGRSMPLESNCEVPSRSRRACDPDRSRLVPTGLSAGSLPISSGRAEHPVKMAAKANMSAFALRFVQSADGALRMNFSCKISPHDRTYAMHRSQSLSIARPSRPGCHSGSCWRRAVQA